MTIEKTPNGRFRAHLKSGRAKVASRTFDTRREATAWLKSGRVKVATRTFDTRREANAWLTRERAALAGGVDPRACKERVRDLPPAGARSAAPPSRRRLGRPVASCCTASPRA